MAKSIRKVLDSEILFQDCYGVLRLAASRSIHDGATSAVQSNKRISNKRYLKNITAVIALFFPFRKINIILSDYVDAFNVMWIETDDLMQTLCCEPHH